MKLTKNSELLLTFFFNKKHIPKVHQTKKTNDILKQLYSKILEGYTYIERLKREQGPSFYNLKFTRIASAGQLPVPKRVDANAIPAIARDRIHKHATMHLSYTFSLFDKEINFNFILEGTQSSIKIAEYNKYVDAMLIWLYSLDKYTTKKTCSKTFAVYFYFTPLKKELPTPTGGSDRHVLGENNINTGFTTTCPVDSEIVIYRKEEWFKVFIHESFHNFALDFSDMDNTECHELILNIFPVESEVYLFESYTECWAEIMNALFCSFFSMNDKTDFNTFLVYTELFIHFEISFSFFQMVKALNFMGLEYKDLYSKSKQSVAKRENLYKEHTNVLSYYVIKLVLLNNYQGFLSWCSSHNSSLLQFKKTRESQLQFCAFIEKNYRTKSMLQNVHNTELFFGKFNNFHKTVKHDKHLKFLLNNMRMTICELG